jgi:hypothetical protein
MSQTISFNGTTRAMAKLEHAITLGPSLEVPGIVTATHTATWHMAGMIEQLRAVHEDFGELLRRGELSAGLVRPDEEPTT